MHRDPRIAFWRTTRRLSGALLLAWLLVTLLVPWFARDTLGWVVFGFPLGYWSSAAGALLVYLVIVVVYGVAMHRLEQRLQDEERAGDRGANARPVEPP